MTEIQKTQTRPGHFLLKRMLLYGFVVLMVGITYFFNYGPLAACVVFLLGILMSVFYMQWQRSAVVAENEKLQQQQLLESFVRNNPYSTEIYDPSGRVLKSNDSFFPGMGTGDGNPGKSMVSLLGLEGKFRQACGGEVVICDHLTFQAESANASTGSLAEKKVFQAIFFPLYDAGKKVQHVVLMIKDLTEQSQLSRKIEEQSRQLSLIDRLIRQVSESLEIQVIAENAVRSLADFLPAESAFMHLIDESGEKLQLVSQIGIPSDVVSQLEEVFVQEGLFLDVFRKGEPLIFDLTPQVREELNWLWSDSIRFVMAVPLISHKRRVGCIFLTSESPRAVTSKEILLLQNVAAQIGVALENALLFHTVQKQLQFELLLRSLAQSIFTANTLSQAFEAAVECITAAMGVDRCLLVLGKPQPEADRVFLKDWQFDFCEVMAESCAEGIEPFEPSQFTIRNDYLAKEILRRQDCFWFDETFASQSGLEYLAKHSLRSVLVASLNFQGKSFGALICQHTGRIRKWTKHDIELMQLVAGQVSVAWENVRLLEGLKASSQKYLDLFENAPAIYLTFDRKGRIIEFNNTLLATVGLTREEVGRINFYELFEKEPGTGIRQKLDGLFLLDEAEVQFEEKFVQGGKVLGEWRFTVHKHRTLGQTSPKLRAIGIDITERNRLEQQLLHSQKLESVGTMAGGIAHDFNNLLTTVLGYTSLGYAELDSAHPFYSRLKTIEQAAQKAAELTQRILTFGRRVEPNRKPVNLNYIIQDTAKILERTISKDVELIMDLGTRLPQILADGGQISQVIMNLCLNAADATPKGGQLRIRTRKVHLNQLECATKSPLQTGDHVILSVSDTGTGIPPEIMDKIFEPFFTTKGPGKGTGLGLAIVYGIITRHNAYLTVTSEEKKGTTFEIYFPAAEEGKQEDDPQQLPPAAGGSETILLVDDEPLVLEVNQRILEHGGYRVLTATSGLDALKIYESSENPVDLVVYDLIMPKMNGRTLEIKLHELNPNLATLCITGYQPDSLMPKGGRYLPILMKPFTADALLRKVREVLDLRSGAENYSGTTI